MTGLFAKGDMDINSKSPPGLPEGKEFILTYFMICIQYEEV